MLPLIDLYGHTFIILSSAPVLCNFTISWFLYEWTLRSSVRMRELKAINGLSFAAVSTTNYRRLNISVNFILAKKCKGNYECKLVFTKRKSDEILYLYFYRFSCILLFSQLISLFSHFSRSFMFAYHYNFAPTLGVNNDWSLTTRACAWHLTAVFMQVWFLLYI